MSVGEPVGTVARRRVLVFRGGIFTVEPSLVPIFGVTVQLGMRKFNLFSFLNGDDTKFSVGSVYKFNAPVQMEKILGTTQQLVLPVDTLHKRLGSCIYWTPSWVQYLEGGVERWQAHPGKTLFFAV